MSAYAIRTLADEVDFAVDMPDSDDPVVQHWLHRMHIALHATLDAAVELKEESKGVARLTAKCTEKTLRAMLRTVRKQWAGKCRDCDGVEQ